MKRFLLLTFLYSQLSTILAQIPVGYYDPAQGLSGSALKNALKNIIDNHTVISYNTIWSKFPLTDKKPNGKVWDMYSDIPDGSPNGNPTYVYTFSIDQCGTYGAEGDCYNREHSWPKSWFNDPNQTTTPGKDMFHIVPTDGTVNGLRSNYPFGEVDAPTTTTQNGGKLGPNVFPGYSGTVFEPIDEYKGDFARSYFYMSTRYQGEDASWAVTDATNKSTILPWQVNLLLSWHNADPVSSKEIARNNAIHTNAQLNRNPYIDNPQWVDSVWSQQLTATATSFSNTCYGNSEGSITVTPSFGQPPYSYSWTGSSSTTNTANNLSAGTYLCTVTDATNSIYAVSVNVTQPTNAVDATGIVDNTTGSITVSPIGGFSPYSFLWTNGATSQNLTGLANGNYSVSVTDANGCTFVTSFNVNSLDLATEVLPISTIFPNPANNSFKLGLENVTIESLQILNAQGKVVINYELLNEINPTIDCSSWASGVYFLNIRCGDKVFVSRLIKS